MTNWLAPNPFEENPSQLPRAGQKIKLRIGWKEPDGRGRDMWVTCRVDSKNRRRCYSKRTGADYAVPGKRWKKGDKRVGRMWRPA